MKKIIIVICGVLLISGLLFFTPAKGYISDTFYIYSMKYIKNANPGKLKGVPIISYHSVSDKAVGEADMTVSPEMFDRQMKCLFDLGYTPIVFNQLDQISGIDKPILITLDDGYEDNYTYAYPVLKKYDFHATIFLISSTTGHEKFLKTGQIQEMSGLIDFESHTVSHKDLTKMSAENVDYEAKESKACLEKLLNKKMQVIAYPFGSYKRSTIPIVQKYYSYAVTFAYGNVFSRPGNYELKRIPIYNYVNIKSFRAVVSTD
jgi:peptidoglycan/xylan/chitin deacetylase (PgdA/CDA1 family)